MEHQPGIRVAHRLGPGCRHVDVLDPGLVASNRTDKKFGQMNTIGVARVLDVDVKVAADDKRAAKQADGFEQR